MTAKAWRAVLPLVGALAGPHCTQPNPAYRPGAGIGDPTRDGGPEVPAADTGVISEGPAGEAAAAEDGGGRESVPAEVRTDAPLASLLGWWRLDESSGGAAQDSSPHGNHGVVEGIAATRAWVVTPRGRGLEFPAGGAADAGLRVGMTGAVPASIRSLQAFTIAAWARRSANLARHHTVMSRQLDGDTEVFNLTFDNDNLVLYVWRPSAPTLVARQTIPPSVASDWIHVAATYDGSSVRVFVDGEGGSPIAHAGGLADSVHPLYIGTNKNAAGTQPFEGVLDEVMLFSEALGAETIRSIRLGTFP